ncbi:MAG TPA: hypothetical protein VIG48_10885 [Jatrophihabitans sp.]
MDVLDDPAFVVPPVPDAPTGVAWLRSHVARFSEGDDHRRRRALAESLLGRVRPDDLRRPGDPTATLAAAFGLPQDVVGDVALVGASYQPHLAVTAEADAAVGRLVSAAGGQWDEASAALIGLLVQAHEATRALIAGRTPPVPFTRRISPSGDEVQVDLSDHPFGAGRHACPGREHALALAEAAQCPQD